MLDPDPDLEKQSGKAGRRGGWRRGRRRVGGHGSVLHLGPTIDGQAKEVELALGCWLPFLALPLTSGPDTVPQLTCLPKGSRTGRPKIYHSVK